jgi:hypothetical protein
VIVLAHGVSSGRTRSILGSESIPRIFPRLDIGKEETMRRIVSILLPLALVLAFTVVATTPVAAGTTYYVATTGDNGNDGSPGSPWLTIQHAVDTVLSGDTIMVAAGTYAGAVVNKQVMIVGAVGGGSVIGSGVCYNAGCSPALTTAFRLDAGADGTEIRNFTIQCNAGISLYFGVFSRGVDDVTVDGLTVNDAVQGITNWGGSNWVVTNNAVTDTVAAGGGGIAIFLGAKPGNAYSGLDICQGNLVEGNTVSAYSTETGYTAPGVCLVLDIRWCTIPADLSGSDDVSNNRIVGNAITGTGNTNEVGIEIGVCGADDAGKVAATMGLVHDNYVEDNTVDGSDYGLYFYVVQDLTVTGNDIKNCATEGITIWDDFTGTIHFNNITGNAYGLYSDVSSRTIDARYNWWGANDGPGTVGPGSGDNVSTYVNFDSWTTQDVTSTGTGTASFVPSAGNVTGLSAVAESSLPPAAQATKPINFPDGLFSFNVTGLSLGQTVTVTIVLPPGSAPTQYWKYHASEGGWIQIPMTVVGPPNVIRITLQDGGLGDDDLTVNGVIIDQGGPGGGAVGWDTFPVSKVRVLLPWITLLAAIAGASLLMLRRRQAQS